LGTHISKPKGATGTYWWGPDEIAYMRSHGNILAQGIYGSATPPSGVTKDDVTAWKQYLTDKYVHKKYAPLQNSIPSSTTPTTPPTTPTKFSPRYSKNKKFTNQPMPDIDLIHFDSPKKSPVESSKTQTPNVSPTQSNDFFGNFGL